MATANITDKMKEYHENMIATIDGLQVGELRSTTVKLRLGNKVYDLTPSKDETFDVENQLRAEFEDKLAEKRLKIKEAIKSKMSEVSLMVSSIQSEYERKEKLLKDTMAKSSPMPNITWDHARRGLSVVKGGGRGEIIWLVKRSYNPKFIDHKNIEPLYVKKLVTNIYLKITTRDSNVIGVSSHYMNSLEYFEHYHQAHPDCWGNWKRPATWSTPEDILKIADDAMAVMENINTMSIASRNPALMPRLETLRRHVLKDVVAPPKVDIKVGTAGVREGLGMAAPHQDVWGN